MVTRHTLVVLLLVCGLLTGQGLAYRHGIVHAVWPASASPVHGPGLSGTFSDDGHADSQAVPCTIPDGAVPTAALPPYRVARPILPDASPEIPATVVRPLPTHRIVDARARAPPPSA